MCPLKLLLHTLFFISKGFDQKTAEFFVTGRKRIIKATPNPDFTLTLSFDNGETRLYDTKPLLKAGTVFEPFLEWSNFRKVYLDDCGCVSWDIDSTLNSSEVWSNKVDLCSDTCYIDSAPIRPDETV